jgi:hypothetical protein
MKMLMLIGAAIGFLLGIALGLAGHVDWPATLLRACACAAALGWLMRWWGRVWFRGLEASIYERRLAEATARQQPSQPTNPAKK